MNALEISEWLRRWFRDDRTNSLAYVARAEAVHAGRERAVQDRAATEMRALVRGHDPQIVLGTSVSASGQPFTVAIGESDLRGGGHLVANGGTGAGKTFWVLSVLVQLLRRRQSGITIIDMKGELATLLREVWLPALVAQLPEPQARDLARRIAVIAPFDESAAVPFQLLTRDNAVPIEVQAHEVATSFGHTIGRDLGILQQTMLRFALHLAIDVGLPFTEVPTLLQDKAMRRDALSKTRLPEVRRYFVERFAKERSGSLVSLLARLDALLMHPGLRRMLATPGMVRFDRLLEHGVNVIDLGGAPAGMRELGKFFGMVLFQRLVRAVFTRRITPTSLPLTVIVDEFQALLSSELAADAERMLEMARSQRVFFWTLYQQAAQVDAVSPLLLRVLATNTNFQVLFRSSLADARPYEHILPVTGRAPRRSAGFPDPRDRIDVMTIEEERRRLLARIPSQPDRMAWFWNRRRQYPAILLKAPFLDGEDAERCAAELSEEIRELVKRGVLARPVADTEPAEPDLVPPPAPEPPAGAPAEAEERPTENQPIREEEIPATAAPRAPTDQVEPPPTPTDRGRGPRPRRVNLG